MLDNTRMQRDCIVLVPIPRHFLLLSDRCYPMMSTLPGVSQHMLFERCLGKQMQQAAKGLWEAAGPGAAAPPASSAKPGQAPTRVQLRGKLFLRADHSPTPRRGYSRAEHQSTWGKARLEKPVVAGNEKRVRVAGATAVAGGAVSL